MGLTATPERTDGTDVRSFFDGRTAAELRLWDALGADLLCPFHYFVVADGTDLRSIGWSRGRYDEDQLSNVYTGNDARSRIVLKELRDKVSDIGEMRALGFCVSVAHAEYMAEVFRRGRGSRPRRQQVRLPARERERALADLRAKRVNILFAADLFNEGLDVPDVDTVLFLRPTESATVFLQQLGRGLRRTRDKAVLTVLDFVGFHRKEFRFDAKLRALTGDTRAGIERQVKEGFPFLPSGCQIVMDRQSQAIVLDNIRAQIANRWQQIVAELRSYGDRGSGQLPRRVRPGTQRHPPPRKLTHGLGFAAMRGCQPAGLVARERSLLKRVRAFAHVDDRLDARRIDACSRTTPLPTPTSRSRNSVWLGCSSTRSGTTVVATAPTREGCRPFEQRSLPEREIASVVDISFEAARHVSMPLTGPHADLPLRVHARYQREEILAALDFPRQPNSFREGVWYSSDRNIDAFFVTLKKSEADYSPTTMYRDYPI